MSSCRYEPPTGGAAKNGVLIDPPKDETEDLLKTSSLMKQWLPYAKVVARSVLWGREWRERDIVDVATIAIVETYFRHDPGRGDFIGLLACVTKSRARDFARSTRSWLQMTLLLDSTDGDSAWLLEGPTEACWGRDHAPYVVAKLDFERSLQRLYKKDPRTAAVVYLYGVLDWTIRGIAEYLEIPRSTVFRQVKRGAVFFRDDLGENPSEQWDKSDG